MAGSEWLKSAKELGLAGELPVAPIGIGRVDAILARVTLNVRTPGRKWLDYLRLFFFLYKGCTTRQVPVVGVGIL